MGFEEAVEQVENTLVVWLLEGVVGDVGEDAALKGFFRVETV